MKEHDESLQIIDKPHVTYASIWLSLTVMVCCLIYFGFEYKKTFDRISMEIKKMDIEILEKKIALEHLKAVSAVEEDVDKGE